MLYRLSNLRSSTALLITLSFALSAGAQSAKSSSHTGLAAFDATHEITLQGAIKEVVPKPTAPPLGLHLMVATTTGAQDVHLGSYLSKNVTENLLHANAQVIVVGSYVNLGGRNVLLARQLVVGGQTIAIRNQNGFLIRPKPEGMIHRVASRTSVTGGAQ
jgi:hypothetical protein